MPDSQIENPVDETENAAVLSQEENGTEAQTETKADRSEADKEAARKAYQQRMERKKWKEQVRAIESAPLTEEDRKAVEDLAKSKGFKVDGDDDQAKSNREQVLLNAEAQKALNAIEVGKIETVLRDASKSILSNTLEELGYEKGSSGYAFIGNHLFKTFGVSNPDVFENKDLVEKEIEGLTAALNRKANKAADPVEKAVHSKAGAPRGSTESRVGGGSGSAASNEVKEMMKERGISEATAKIFLEKEKSLPKWMR